MSSNLPPGVTESMIPGNRPEDEAWDRLIDDIGGDCPDPEAARQRWVAGAEPAKLQAAVEDVAYAIKTGVRPETRDGPDPYHMTKDELIAYVGSRLAGATGA